MNKVKEAVSLAEASAARAVEEFQREHPNFHGACGFAWVDVTIDGRSPVAREFKKLGFRKSHVPKTLQLWCRLMTQDMAIKEAWARAYAEELRNHGFEAYPGSRMD